MQMTTHAGLVSTVRLCYFAATMIISTFRSGLPYRRPRQAHARDGGFAGSIQASHTALTSSK